MTLVGLVSALLLKPAALVSVAFGMTALMRRTGAASRHVVWTATVITTLALPILAAALPDLRINSFDEGVRRVSVKTHAAGPSRDSLSATPIGRVSPASNYVAPHGETGDTPDHLVQWALTVWAFVALLFLLRRLDAERRVHVLVVNARGLSGRLREIAVEVARQSGVSSAKLRLSEQISSPAVVGIIHPVVLLPESATSWDERDVKAVLTHELGHAARRDGLLNFCADLAASFYWCNPLVLLAVRRMRLEAEKACDERVVGSGATPHDYAELLVRVARADRCALSRSAAAIAISRSRELETRIVALIDGHVPYPPASTRMMALLVTIGIAITLPAAALTLSAADVPIQLPANQEPDRLGDSLTAPASELVPFRIEPRELQQRISQALAGRDSLFAQRLAAALDHTPSHEADFVRERALWALSRTANGRLIEPLLESLADDDWRIQAYAAWALTVAGDPRAVPQLIGLLQHRVWRVRAMAASALRQMRDVRALAAMRDALTDPAWQVRTEAVEYLAAVGGDSVHDALRARVNDRHVAVRQAARRALNIF